MAFKTKADYYGLGAITGLKLISTNENKSASTAEARGEDGFVVAVESYGTTSAPSCELNVIADTSLANIVLGTVKTIGTDKFCLASLSISTSAGGVPTISASGQQVEANAQEKCTCTLPAISISALHHAQNFGAFTLGGTGAHLTQCNMEIGGTISTATKDGEVIAHDLTDVRMTVTATIQVSDSTYGTPTVTAATGWTVTSPLSETNPDADFPTYTVTLQKTLTADED